MALKSCQVGISVLMVILTINVQAQEPYTLTSDDVEVVDGIIQCVYYDFENKHVVIPDWLDEQKVVGIADKDFNETDGFIGKGIESVLLPPTLIVIGSNAFAFNLLGHVDIPAGVTSIGSYAFASNQLASVSIREGVITINEGAFGDNQLVSVIIPESVTTIGDYAFESNQLVNVMIPMNVTMLSDYAFKSNQLISITIREEVPAMITGKDAFESKDLSYFNIMDSVSIISADVSKEKYVYPN